MWPTFILACAGGADTEPASSDSADTGLTDDTTTEDSGETEDTGTTGVLLTASLTGTVVGPDGAPLVDVAVNICRLVCLRVSPDDAGRYSYPELEAWTASFYVIPDVESGLATAMAPITWADGEDKVIDVRMVVLDDPLPIPASAEEVEVTEGLWLTLGMDTLEPPFGVDLEDVAAVRVPEADRLPIELDGEVLDVWYIHPWEAESEEGAPVRVANAWGLAPGESVRAWASSLPLEYSWLDAGTLTVTEDGGMLEGDAALPVLTTLVLTRE